MRRALLVVAAASCVSGPAPDLELDLGRICTKVALEVRDPALLPGWEVHTLAVERSEGEGAWALASDGEGRLQLVHSPDQAAHDFSAVATRDELQLVPGALEGQTWLLLDRPGEAQVWRTSDEDGSLLAGPRLLDFPTAGDWTRRVVFLDRAAHLLSVPVHADAGTVEVSLSRLDDALAPEAALVLPLWQNCPEGQVDVTAPCRPPLIDGPVTLELLAATDDRTGFAAALIAMYSIRTSDLPATGAYTTLVTNIELHSLGPDRPPAIVRHDLPYWITNFPVAVSPAFIATDNDALYWLAGLRSLADDPTPPTQDFVYRAPHDAMTGQTGISATRSMDLGAHLLAIGGTVALGQVEDRLWSLAPLGERGVDVEVTGSLEVPSGARVSLAGRGQFLVSADAGSWRVAATCEAK